MDIDAKGVGAFVWKILSFSTHTICRYVRKYPVVSSVSTFVFLLYVFFPSVFYFLLFSSPLVAIAAFYIRNNLSSSPPKIRNSSKEKKTEKGSSSSDQKGSVSGDGRNRRAYLRPQRSVRRNARGKVEEVGKDWDSLQSSENETDRVILTTLYGDLPSESDPDFKKLKKDKALLAAEESLFGHVADSSSSETENVLIDSFAKVNETEVESSSSEEEESRVEINKAVAWTADDQKNLMDLGTSEIERNKRLENLIARRRARRLFLLAAERSLRGMGIPPVCVERNYFGLDNEYYDIDGLQMPGSAPSVLLPTRNPFDLPYDPQEEKPNLSGDSFLQEFAVGSQKDTFFCRHESFRRGIFAPEIQKKSKFEPWRKAIDGQGSSRNKPQQDGGIDDGLVEQQQPLTKESDHTRREGSNMESCSGHRSEVQTETGAIRKDHIDSSSSLSPQDSEINFDFSNQTNGKTFCKRSCDHIGDSLAGLVPRNNVSSSLGAERQRYMEHFGYSASRRHMVTHSVDSDLQVEVSEVGSPPTTVDENDYSDDEKSSSVCESETEMKPKNIVDTSARFETLPVEIGVHGGSLKDDGPKPREFQSQSPSDRSNVIPLEISNRESHIMEEPVATHPDEVFSERLEESLEPSENPADEIKISYDSDEAEPSEKTDQESQGSGDNSSEERAALEMQEVVETEASDVDNGNADESTPSPRSVLPDVLSLDQAYSVQSEDLENLRVEHSPPVNAAPESLQNQSFGGSNTEEPESSLNLDSGVTVSEESKVATASSEEMNPLKHENLNSSDQRMAGDEPEAVRDVQEESKTAQDLQISGEEKTYALNSEDEDHTSADRSQSGKTVPVSFQNESAAERNVQEPEGSSITLSGESRVNSPTIIEKSYEDSSKDVQDSEDQVKLQAKGITEDEPETVRDVQEVSQTAEEHGLIVDPSAEEVKNDQKDQREERI